jgi:hypothetical protein
MRSRWEALHTGLMRSISSHEAATFFEEARVRFASLHKFSGPVALVEALAPSRNLDDKDPALRALVLASRHGATRRLAQSLLLLCFWPALDSIFRRRERLFRDRPHDLAAEIVDHFTTQVHRVNLGRVTCLTAMLIRSTEREVLEARARDWASEARRAAVSPEMADHSTVPPGTPLFGTSCAQWTAESIGVLYNWLRTAVGKDADLVVGAVILEKSGRELSEALGISHEAARQRLGRALTRARNAFLTEGQSQTGAPDRLC